MASLPSREVWPLAGAFRDNQQLAYMFMICSNIKLTTPAESIGIAAGLIHKWNQRDFKDGSIAQAGNPGGRGQVRCLLRIQRYRDAGFQRRQGPRLDRPRHGICHSYAPDGRCISLLKILLTNACNYDCLYCVNRASSNVARARFTIDEVVKLTLDFYRRNYIEGLFLSSGIIRSADYTMEQVVAVARKLREEHHFRGYIHLKTIPEADEALIAEAGKYADRLSINIELPLETSLKTFAPEKDQRAIRFADLSRLHVIRNKALPFIVLSDYRPAPAQLDGTGLAARFRPKARQLGFGF